MIEGGRYRPKWKLDVMARGPNCVTKKVTTGLTTGELVEIKEKELQNAAASWTKIQLNYLKA